MAALTHLWGPALCHFLVCCALLGVAASPSALASGGPSDCDAGDDVRLLQSLTPKRKGGRQPRHRATQGQHQWRVGQWDPSASLGPLGLTAAGPEDGFGVETGDPSCEAFTCALREVSREELRGTIAPGAHLPPSLQGVFRVEGLGSVQAITFDGWEDELLEDGSFRLSGQLYASGTLTLDGSEGARELYQALRTFRVVLTMSCSLQDGDARNCTAQPIAFGGAFFAPPSNLLSFVCETDSSAQQVTWDCQRHSLGLARERVILTQAVNTRGDLIHRKFTQWPERLLVAEPTRVPDDPSSIPSAVINATATLLKAIMMQEWEGVDLLGILMQEQEVDWNPESPEFDVWEVKTRQNPVIGMCPQQQNVNLVAGAAQVGGVFRALSKVRQILQMNIIKKKEVATSTAVNPYEDPWYKENGPVWGVSWYAFQELLSIFVALPVFVIGTQGNRTTTFMQWAEATCFAPSLLVGGPMVFSWDEVNGDTQDLGQRRAFYTATAPQSLSIFNTDGAIFLSNGPQHTALRRAYEAAQFARKFPVPLDFIAQSDNSSDVGELVTQVSLYMLWGAFPPSELVLQVQSYLTWGKLGIFGSVIEKFILGPLGKAEEVVRQRKATRDWAMTTSEAQSVLGLPEVKSYMAAYPPQPGSTAPELAGTPQEHYLQNIIDISLFAGLLGITDLVDKCISYQQDHPDLVPAFLEDPMAFAVELMRFDSAVTSFTPLFQKDTTLIVDGVNITQAEDSVYQSTIASANRDQSHWVEDVSWINTKRAQLGDTLSWNGQARYVEQRDFTKVPRHCPGYCASIKAGVAMCAQRTGVFQQLLDAGKLSAEVSCSIFVNDCEGAWGDWGDCSRSCESGVRIRTYRIQRGASGRGRQCPYPDGHVEVRKCNPELCPAKCSATTPDGSCKVLTLKGYKEENCSSVTSFASWAIWALGTQVFFDDLVFKFPDGTPFIINRADDSVTWDAESWDQFTARAFFFVAKADVEFFHTMEFAQDIEMPSAQKEVRSLVSGPGVLTPMLDIDGATLDMQPGCLLLDIRPLVWRDDLDVSMRNRWELVMNQSKYYTPEVENAIGKPFRRFADYVYEIFVWYKTKDGLPIYPIRVNWARLFLPSYPESGPWEDRAEQAIAFRHIGSHLLEKVSRPPSLGGETAAYAVRTSQFRALAVRDGFARLGLDMLFSAEGLPLAVQIPVDGVPRTLWKAQLTQQEWQYYKFVWRSSLTAVVTLRDHLLTCHMSVANLLATAARATLSPSHPLRRFFTRFTYGTIDVNNRAQTTLVATNGILQRLLPWADFPGVVQDVWGNLESVYKLTRPMRNPRTLDKVLRSVPYFKDGRQLYLILQQLTRDFLGLYEESWCRRRKGKLVDPEVLNFLQKLKSLADSMGVGQILNVPRSPQIFRCRELNQFSLQLTGLLFIVTAFHAQAGTFVDMTIDPEFSAWSWPEEEGAGRPKQSILLAILASTTARPMPTLVEDYGHLCEGILREAGCRRAFCKARRAFQVLSKAIDEENLGRLVPYVQMNPSFVETSVAK